jgi:hypothetical protein
MCPQGCVDLGGVDETLSISALAGVKMTQLGRRATPVSQEVITIICSAVCVILSKQSNMPVPQFPYPSSGVNSHAHPTG